MGARDTLQTLRAENIPGSPPMEIWRERGSAEEGHFLPHSRELGSRVQARGLLVSLRHGNPGQGRPSSVLGTIDKQLELPGVTALQILWKIRSSKKNK